MFFYAAFVFIKCIWNAKGFFSRDGLGTPQCPWRGKCPIHRARLLPLGLSRWSSLSSRQDPWVCADRRYSTVCHRCSWLETAEHSSFSHSHHQVSPLYICASKVVCSVPFWIRLLFIPLFVSPLYCHCRPSQLRYQDHLVERKPWHFVAPVRIFSLLRLIILSWIKIFFSASCFRTLLIWYDMIWYMIWYMIYIYELQLHFHRWVTAVGKLVQKYIQRVKQYTK